MTAKRFGGPNSPGGNPRPASDAPARTVFTGRKATSVDLRTLVLYALPTPLLFSAIGSIFAGDAIGGILDLAAASAIYFGAFLTAEGLKAEQAYRRRLIAKPPAFPRKLAGAVFIALGVAVAVLFGWKAGLLNTILFGALAGGAHVASFGFDPMKAKGLTGDGISEAEALRVSEALEKAEALVGEITAEADRLNDRDLSARVAAMCAAVREVLQMVEEDPRDLTRARRFLGVYLRGARDATVKYAASRDKLGEGAMREEYVALIGDMEGSFTRARQMLTEDDRTDLEVEIEVLRERLQQEGV